MADEKIIQITSDQGVVALTNHGRIFTNFFENGQCLWQELILPDLKKSKPEKKKQFVKPEYTEVIEYINSNKFNVNASQFLNHYDTNGWMVGKTKMKDWKAAVRNWHSRNKEVKQNEENRNTSTSKAKQFSDTIDRIVQDDIRQNGFVDNVGGSDI